jgi:hypothetical protein
MIYSRIILRMISCYHTEKQNRNNKADNKPRRKYFRVKKVTTVRNQNLIHEKSKSRFHFRNDCYHLVQNLLSSLLQSKNVNTKTCKTMLSPAVLYVCETRSLTLREGNWLKVSENGVLTVHSFMCGAFYGAVKSSHYTAWNGITVSE